MLFYVARERGGQVPFYEYIYLQLMCDAIHLKRWLSRTITRDIYLAPDEDTLYGIHTMALLADLQNANVTGLNFEVVDEHITVANDIFIDFDALSTSDLDVINDVLAATKNLETPQWVPNLSSITGAVMSPYEASNSTELAWLGPKEIATMLGLDEHVMEVVRRYNEKPLIGSTFRDSVRRNND